MSNLLFYTPGRFKALSHLPDVQLWLSMFKVFNDNVAYIDRTGVTVNPIRSTTVDHIKLPEADPTFNKTFRECALITAENIYKKHTEHQVPIRLFWSGGIDSTAALLAFIELLGIAEAKRSIEIVMSSRSILENPYTWEKVVRKENFTIHNALHFKEQWNGDSIIVNGECGDQVQGGEGYRNLGNIFGANAITTPWNLENISKFVSIRSGLNTQQTEQLVHIFVQQVQQAPIPLTTMGDFSWWLNFSGKWASTYYRTATKSPSALTNEFFDNYFFPFYASDEFQLWSMYTRHEQHKGDWASYKWAAKDFICDCLGSSEYQLKHRHGSLVAVLNHSARASAIDDQLRLYQDIDPEEWYNPINSFKML
jgi:hypothetical protein